ncbi:hypothetical protein Tco_0509161 [Tanacetum coccineum]
MAALMYKDDHNKLAYLGRERGCEDFTDIFSYLDLWRDVNMLCQSLHSDDVEDFWSTQDEWIVCSWKLYPKSSVHVLDLTNGKTVYIPKAGSWNQFPSSIATALICLSTGRVYNFSRFILEGLIANVKATRHKFLMYPRFLQMLVAIETADRTPRPTFGFTRKLYTNMKLKWEGEAIPLTPPMLAIAAAGNDAADEENVLAHAVAGSPAEAHPPPFSPVREPTPERLPETEWVVPIPVSPITDWRPWPSVPAPSPIRNPTPEPASPPTPPAQTMRFEEPLVFGPVPKPAGYVDPDNIDPIIFGPPPRPYDFVDPALVESVLFVPTKCLTHAGPDDAPNTTNRCSWKAEDPAHSNSYLQSMTGTRPWRRFPLSVRGRSRRARQVPILRRFAQFSMLLLVHDVLPHAESLNPLGSRLELDKGKAPMPDLEIPAEFLAEDAQARQHASKKNPAKNDELLLRMTERTDWLTLSAIGTERNNSPWQIALSSTVQAKPLKQIRITKMMRNLVKNQWCAAHNGTITMKLPPAVSDSAAVEVFILWFYSYVWSAFPETAGVH